MIQFVLTLMKDLFFLIYTAEHDKISAFTKFYLKIDGFFDEDTEKKSARN